MGGPGNIEIQEMDRNWIDQPKDHLKKIDGQVAELNKILGSEVFEVDEIRRGFWINTVEEDDLELLYTGLNYESHPPKEDVSSYYPRTKMMLLERLKMEIESGAFPSDVVDIFQKAESRLMEEECNRENFKNFYTIWKKGVLDTVENNEELSRCSRLYQDFESSQTLFNSLKEKGEESKAKKIGSGYIIDRVLNFDVNTFSAGKSIPELRYFQRARRGMILIADYEINYEDTPSELKKRLKLFKETTAGDWDRKEKFDNAYKNWETNIWNWMKKEAVNNPNYKRALEDHQKAHEALREKK